MQQYGCRRSELLKYRIQYRYLFTNSILHVIVCTDVCIYLYVYVISKDLSYVICMNK